MQKRKGKEEEEKRKECDVLVNIIDVGMDKGLMFKKASYCSYQ